MRSVAEELSVSFDAKELELKLWASLQTEHDMLEKGSRKPAELAMPSSSKQICVENASCEEQEDILEKSLTKPTEPAMSLFDKTKYNGDAPCERKNKDMLENYSTKLIELATDSSNNQKVTENVPCKRNYDAEPAHHTEKVEIQLIQKNIQSVADAHHTIDENSRKQQPYVSDEKEHLQKPMSPVDTNRTQKDVQKLNRRVVRHLEKELMEAVELDLNGLTKNGFGAVRFPEAEGNKTVQLNVKPNEAARDFHIEKENDEVLHCSRLHGGSEHNEGHADSGLRAQRLENQGHPVSPLSGNTRKKAPYTKPNVVNIKNPTKKQANNGFLHDKPQHLADLGYPVQKGQGDPERALTMLSPYVEPKSNMQPVNDDPEKQTSNGYRKSNIPGQTDHLENKNVLRPVSVRRRTAKLPAPVDAYVECLTMRSKTNAQITPSSQSKHIGRRNGALNHKNNSGRLMQRMQPEAAETAIDCGNLLLT
ncbi:hypothetical protein Zm00014a_035047 [Zea mays]|uniref:Uncharacterized protein n=1 Tax=Zea mays TaxID=4577 RepID=A0A3L6F224_MAIZE|nr:hypothetical protein Zm00014a_035047 [Zea mays]